MVGVWSQVINVAETSTRMTEKNPLGLARGWSLRIQAREGNKVVCQGCFVVLEWVSFESVVMEMLK